MLKGQDIVILLKILSRANLAKVRHEELLSQNKLAVQLCMSVSEVHAGIKRLVLSGLLGQVTGVNAGRNSNRKHFLPIIAACEECLLSAVKFFIPAELGTYTRGIATSYAAPIFKQHIVLGDDPIPVWPSADGKQRGLALEPLYRSVPNSLSQYPDDLFYELLVLVDTIRSGRTRERNIAVKLLKARINSEK
ncbi:MAG: hypothetical protein COC15_05170 [Legionellales bacterium]|nr:MAG: hypothetical protein COC15_05170 [Legionellales bacterium]